MAFSAAQGAPELATEATAIAGPFGLCHVALQTWGIEATGWTDEKGSLETSTAPDVPPYPATPILSPGPVS